ncbi:hypothetical protein QEN19_003527 [Hanseniaspora menglaensis]
MLEFIIGERLDSLEDIIEFVEKFYFNESGSSKNPSSKINSEEYSFIYKVLDFNIKRAYENTDYKRIQLLEYLSNFKPDVEDTKYSIINDDEIFKNLMFEILKGKNGEYFHIYVILISFINDGKFNDFRSNDLVSKLFVFDIYLELLKFKFIILQLKHKAKNIKIFQELSNLLLENLSWQSFPTDLYLSDYIEYHYLERYTSEFKIPFYIIDKIKIQIMMNEYMHIFKKSMLKLIDDWDFQVYIEHIFHINKDSNKRVSFFLAETNDATNEWIIKEENPINDQFSASVFNTLVKDCFIRVIDVINISSDNVRVLWPSKALFKKAESSFMKLPDQILKRVMSKLSNRQLHSILTLNKRLANIICEILYYRPFITDLKHLQKLELSVLKSSMKLTSFPYHVYVKRLNFSFFNHLVDDYTLKHMSSSTLVERLTLVNCHSVNGTSVAFFIDNLNYNVLTSLDLSGVSDLNDIIIMALVNKCSVSLQGLYSPNLNCSNKFLTELIKHCINLKRLRLSNCQNMDSLVSMNIGNYLNRLVELDLSGSENVNSESVYRFFSKLANLRDVNLNGCKKLESKFIISLYDANKKLNRLKNLDIGNLNNFSSFKDSDIEKLVYIAPNLKHLTLSKHKELSNESLKYISRLNKTLTTLNIGHLVKITDVGINYLLGCTKITYLDLSSCEKLSAEGLISLFAFKRLKRLGLVKCSQLDDYTLLIFLSKTQAKLERVHLSYCQQLSGFSILELLRRHINIQHLSVSGIPAIRSMSPSIRQFSRPSPSSFTSEQRISFAIFSGYRDVNNFKKTLNDELIDKSITRIFSSETTNYSLFDSYLKYCNYGNLNYMQLMRKNIKELINTTLAYDYVINRYDINTINYNEEVIILEIKMILESDNGNNLLDINSLSAYFNDVFHEETVLLENGSEIKNSSLNDLKYSIEELGSLTGKNREKKDKFTMSYEELSVFIKENNELITILKKSLEIWENNLFSYLTVPTQRASIQQFKRIEAIVPLLKVLYSNLYLLKEKASEKDSLTWIQQIKPILAYILNKFEQLSFISFFRELITLFNSIKSHEFISNWSVVINLTSCLRDNILNYRSELYLLEENDKKIALLQKAKEKFLYDLLELGTLVTGDENIEIFPGFHI